jgi:hypothetical protein
MHLCFALYEGQAENHLYIFPYDLNTRLTFIVSFSWSFVYVHLHVYNMVAKFFLSRLCLSCLIRLKHIYNFWCSMLVFTPFALCFVTFCGIFMWFLELTYWQDATVPVSCFLLFLCFRKVTQEIFSELDETSSRTPIFPGQRTRTEGEPEGGQGPASHQGGAAQPLAAPPMCEEPLAAPWRRSFAYIKPQDRKPKGSRQFSRKSSAAPPPPSTNFEG